jgi:NAD(P)-dependent dehydrogenase (short-subunit alcohol dehydrogenase family)
MIAFLAFIAFYYMLVLLIRLRRTLSPKKKFSKENCTNILITGGVQGLGKRLAHEFVVNNVCGSVNLIVVDIAGHLAPTLIEDICEAGGGCGCGGGDKAFKKRHVHFVKCNLANKAEVEQVWASIVQTYGPVHILVNNAARCLGMPFQKMTIDQVQLTMNINFMAYVHLVMLFLHQKECIRQTTTATRGADAGGQSSSVQNQISVFHIVNVISIAGHIGFKHSTDYCASKFATTGFFDCLRQELFSVNNPIKMTNFYPYYIDTGLFAGFNPLLGYIIPTLKLDDVANRMYKSIMAEEEEVYIYSFVFWLKTIVQLLPVTVKNVLLDVLIGSGMDQFLGRK